MYYPTQQFTLEYINLTPRLIPGVMTGLPKLGFRKNILSENPPTTYILEKIRAILEEFRQKLGT